MSTQALKNGVHPSPTVGDVTTQASSLAHDLITLAELQAKLLYVDVREAGARSATSAVGLAAMLALALSSIPVMLLGLAHFLHDSTTLSLGAANLIVGGVVGIGAVVAGWIFFQKFRRVTAVFSRTQQEFQDNLEFIKSLVGDRSDRQPWRERNEAYPYR